MLSNSLDSDKKIKTCALVKPRKDVFSFKDFLEMEIDKFRRLAEKDASDQEVVGPFYAVILMGAQ